MRNLNTGPRFLNQVPTVGGLLCSPSMWYPPAILGSRTVGSEATSHACPFL